MVCLYKYDHTSYLHQLDSNKHNQLDFDIIVCLKNLQYLGVTFQSKDLLNNLLLMLLKQYFEMD